MKTREEVKGEIGILNLNLTWQHMWIALSAFFIDHFNTVSQTDKIEKKERKM